MSNDNKSQADSSALQKRMDVLEKQNKTLSQELNKARELVKGNQDQQRDLIDRFESVVASLESKSSEIKKLEEERDALRNVAEVRNDESGKFQLAQQLAATQARLELLENQETDPAVINAKRDEHARRLSNRVKAILDGTRSKVNLGEHQYRVKPPYFREMVMNSTCETVDDFIAKDFPARFGSFKGTHIKVEKIEPVPAGA